MSHFICRNFLLQRLSIHVQRHNVIAEEHFRMVVKPVTWPDFLERILLLIYFCPPDKTYAFITRFKNYFITTIISIRIIAFLITITVIFLLIENSSLGT